MEIAPGKTQGREFDLPYNTVKQKDFESTNMCISYDAYARKNFQHIL